MFSCRSGHSAADGNPQMFSARCSRGVDRSQQTRTDAAEQVEQETPVLEVTANHRAASPLLQIPDLLQVPIETQSELSWLSLDTRGGVSSAEPRNSRAARSWALISSPD